jgi:hypothetical protein
VQSSKFWAFMGALVGLFLMPTTWMALFAVTAGATIAGALRDFGALSQPDTGLPGFDPSTGDIVPPTTLAEATANQGSGPHVPLTWIVLGGLIALVATIASSVFFGAMGYRLSALYNARHGTEPRARFEPQAVASSGQVQSS